MFGSTAGPTPIIPDAVPGRACAAGLPAAAASSEACFELVSPIGASAGPAAMRCICSLPSAGPSPNDMTSAMAITASRG